MKKFLALLLSFVFLFMVACSADTDNSVSTKKTDKNKKENANTVTVAGDAVDTSFAADEIFSDNDKTEYSASYAGTDLYLEKRKKIIIEDVAEIELENTAITKDALPSNTDGYYSYYEGDIGKIFVDINLKYKNLGNKAVDCDDAVDINTAYYSGKYQYSGFVAAEDADGAGFSSYDSIDPLESVNVHCFIRMPEFVEYSDGEIVVTLDIGDELYAVKVREGTLGKDSSLEKDAEFRKSGEIKDNERIIIKDKCVFSIIGSEFTNDVLPLRTDDFYSHYEADEGKAYLCIRLNYINLADEPEDIDDSVDADMKYKKKYEYGCFTVKLDGEQNGFESYSELYPLSDEYIYCLFDVPQEVADSEDCVEVTFEICGNTYVYTVR